LLALSLSGLLGTACIGRLEDGPGGDSPRGPGRNGGGTGGGPLPEAPPPGKPDDPITGPIASVPGPSSRLVRLNHKQWASTVGDLLRLPAPAAQASSFLSESVRTSFDNNGSVLDVSPELWLDYQKGAEAVAVQVARDPRLLAALQPSGGPSDMAGRARAFVTNLGLRAFRRPLTDAEVGRYVNVFNMGPALLGSGDAFADGAELVISALLQSPNFLYRAEWSTAVTNGKVALGDYEIASRLSYGLTNSMPDDALFAAAAKKELHTRDQVLNHARRLLDSPKGEATVHDFHEQLFHTEDYAAIKRDPMRQPAWKTGMGDAMRKETETFLHDIVFGQERGVTEMLTASYSFINSTLAPLYGVNMPAGTDFVRTELDKSQRAGLFTQVGFLGNNDNATDVSTRPIMRGTHINIRALCADLPAPPNVPPLPPQDMGKTTRDMITAFTEQKGSICFSCHASIINPIGFAFESYDAIGKWRTTDNGAPVDATGAYEFAEGEKSFDGAVELMKIMAEGKQAHDCYSRHLFEYLYGRDMISDAPSDLNLIGELGRRSKGNGKGTASIKALILDLLSTDAFLTRLP
jgi:hypothetical protein